MSLWSAEAIALRDVLDELKNSLTNTNRGSTLQILSSWLNNQPVESHLYYALQRADHIIKQKQLDDESNQSNQSANPPQPLAWEREVIRAYLDETDRYLWSMYDNQAPSDYNKEWMRLTVVARILTQLIA